MSTSQCLVPKLTYFGLAGRLWGLRVAMYAAFGKEGWQDERIAFADWANTFKPIMPLGSLPVLTLVDGTMIAQTDAITRWAGKQGGLYPEDVNDALIVDEVIATSFEALGKTPTGAKDDEEKKIQREEYAAGFLSKALALMDKRVETANAAGRGPWVSGGKLSIGDLTLVMLTEMILGGQFDYVPASLILEGFPLLAAHRDSVKGHTLVQEYVKNYPN